MEPHVLLQRLFYGQKVAIGGGRLDARFAVTLTTLGTMLPTKTFTLNGLMLRRNLTTSRSTPW